MSQLEVVEIQTNSEEIQEIITAVPSWILRWGITVVLAVVICVVLLSSIIQYPDIIRTNLKVNSLNSPKQVLARQNGKLTNLLVHNGEFVEKQQALAYMESTANPKDVLKLNSKLKELQLQMIKNNYIKVELPILMNLGELQGSYQDFYQQYLQYQSTQDNGYYRNKIIFLEKDLKDIGALKQQIVAQEKVQQQEFSNQENEYLAYQKLYQHKVISRSEFTQQENKYFAAKYPLQQSTTSLITNSGNLSAKEKELLEVKHTISEEQAKFTQSLNRCVSESEGWIVQHILVAPVSGKVSFAGIVQQNQNVFANQEIFIVNPGNSNFFGEIQIPQFNMGKIKLNERTLIKLKSYPFEQYGMIRGRLTYISDVAYRDSVFIAKVSFDYFENKDSKYRIVLKNGMQANAEIITEDSSLLMRFYRNVIKLLNSN